MIMGVADWMVQSGYQGSEDEERFPLTCFTTSTNHLPAYQLLLMSHSSLCNGAPFEFLSSCIAGETITFWDHRNFPCAHADSMIAYPTSAEVGKANPFLLL